MRLSISLNLTIALDGHKLFTRASWGRLRKRVKRRDKAICQYCNEPAPDGGVDHIIPLSKGGLDILDNLAWSCESCNNSKGNKTPEEWRDTIQKKEKAREKATAMDEATRTIYLLGAEGLSASAIAERVYGYKNSRVLEQIRAILDE